MGILRTIYVFFRFKIWRSFVYLLPMQYRQNKLEKLIMDSSRFVIDSLGNDLEGLYPLHVKQAREVLHRSQAAYNDPSLSENDRMSVYKDLLEACTMLRNISKSLSDQEKSNA